MRRLGALLDSWIFRTYRTTPDDLAAFRIVYAGYMLLAVAPVAPWLPRVPGVFFNPPPGLPSLFGGFPSAALMSWANALLVVLLLMLLVGWRTAEVSMAAAAVFLLLKSWEYGTGKINHDILLVLIPAIFAGSGWGRARSVDARVVRPRPPVGAEYSWSLALLACVIGVAMFSAGGLKLVSGWLDPATHATYGHLVINVGLGRETWLSQRLLGVDSWLLWEAADWGATTLELAFIGAMLRPSTMRVALIAAAAFHLSVWLLFGINFAHNLVAYSVFFPLWPRGFGSALRPPRSAG